MFSSMFQSASTFVSDSYLELKDAVISREEASEDMLTAPTPSDRWFSDGWAKNPAEMPASFMTLVPKGYKIVPWEPPPLLTPTIADNKSDQAKSRLIGELFDMRSQRPKFGELLVEVLEADGLANSLLQGGVVDPYALLVFETGAARTSQVRNDATPRWGAEAPRAFKFDIRCPYSLLYVALLDSDQCEDDPLGRVVISICDLCTHTTYGKSRCRHTTYGTTKPACRHTTYGTPS